MKTESHEYDAKFEVLRGNVPLCTLRAESGSAPNVSFSGDAEIKMTFSGEFSEIPENVNFLRDQLRPYLMIDGVLYPAGRFVVTTPDEEISESDRRVFKVTGYDLLYLAKTSVLETRPCYPAGTLYTDLVERLLVESGISEYTITPSDAELTTTREDWEVGTDRLTILNQLLSEINYQSAWMDLDGRVHAEPAKSALIQNVRWSYRHGEKGVLLPGWSREVDVFGVPNVFIVRVENPDYPDVMQVTVEDTDPESPTSIVNIGRRIVSVETLDNIASYAHLEAYAKNLALRKRIASEVVTFESRLEPGHGAGDILSLARPGMFGVFSETSWSMDLGYNGAMVHTAKRVIL